MEKAKIDMIIGGKSRSIRIRSMTQAQIDGGEFSAFEHVSQFFRPYVWYWKITTEKGKAGLFMIFWELRACFATDDGAVTWGKWIQREEGLLIDNNLLIDAFSGGKIIPLLDCNCKLMNIKLDPKYRVRIPTLEEDPFAWIPITSTPFKTYQIRD